MGDTCEMQISKVKPTNDAIILRDKARQSLQG